MWIQMQTGPKIEAFMVGGPSGEKKRGGDGNPHSEVWFCSGPGQWQHSQGLSNRSGEWPHQPVPKPSMDACVCSERAPGLNNTNPLLNAKQGELPRIIRSELSSTKQTSLLQTQQPGLGSGGHREGEGEPAAARGREGRQSCSPALGSPIPAARRRQPCDQRRSPLSTAVRSPPRWRRGQREPAPRGAPLCRRPLPEPEPGPEPEPEPGGSRSPALHHRPPARRAAAPGGGGDAARAAEHLGAAAAPGCADAGAPRGGGGRRNPLHPLPPARRRRHPGGSMGGGPGLRRCGWAGQGSSKMLWPSRRSRAAAA